MKSVFKRVLSVLIVLTLCLSVSSCGEKKNAEDLWQTAIYTEDTEIGSGAKTLTVRVIAEERSVALTLHTDKDILGDALSEHDLIAGEMGAYGLYVKTVNGILADYNSTQSYWAVEKDGEYMSVGVDSAEIKDGESYEFIYTKN